MSEKQKIHEIREFIDTFITASKKRGKMYGSISDIESQWYVLDQINFILEGVPKELVGTVAWGTFLSYKGYGAKSAASIIDEGSFDDPYTVLTNLRNEYEEWRAQKIADMQC